LKQAGKAVIWPANIDLSKTRSDGRRMPKAQAVDSPKITEIAEAAGKLGLEPEAKQDASRPSCWWEKTGYVIVNKKGKTKSAILRVVAKQIIEARRAKAK